LQCVYGVLVLRFDKDDMSSLFQVCRSTINRWIKQYEEEGSISRRQSITTPSKLRDCHTDWIVSHISANPLDSLHQIKVLFQEEFRGMTISISSVWKVLSARGFSYQVLERRALQTKRSKICEYAVEFNSLVPLLDQLVFLDEVSFDNRSMLQKRGYFKRNGTPVFHGVFRRSERHSLLAFCNINGLLEVFRTEGTFTRVKFFNSLRTLIRSGKICGWPGRNSLWVMDGAQIHMCTDIIHYIRLCGVKIIILPPYCPFYNPIEYLFGFMKEFMKSIYHTWGTESDVMLQAIERFSQYDMEAIFSKCGYHDGYFDQLANYKSTYSI